MSSHRSPAPIASTAPLTSPPITDLVRGLNAEESLLRYARHSRNATVVIAWIIGLAAIASVMLGIYVAHQLWLLNHAVS